MTDDAGPAVDLNSRAERLWDAEAGPRRLRDRIDPRLLPPEALIDSILNREPALDDEHSTWLSTRNDGSDP